MSWILASCILFVQLLLSSSPLFWVVKLRGPWVCWSGGSVLSGTGGPNRLVLMARTNKCMSRTRNHIASLFLFGLGCIRPVDADLVPWALLTTRTTVSGPTVSVNCPLLVWVSGLQFYALELASWKPQPECHYLYLQHGVLVFLVL